MPLPSRARRSIVGSADSRRNRTKFLDRLVESRFRSKEYLGRLLRQEEEVRAAERLDLKPEAYYLKGVHKGVFYRIKLPPQEQSRLSRLALPTVPKITSSPLVAQPHAFRKIPASASHGHPQHQQHPSHPPHYSHSPTIVAAGGGTVDVAAGSPLITSSMAAAGAARRREDLKDFWWRLKEWWKENWSIVALNLGSICTLIGFTRSDVLELRMFSMAGSMGAVVYNATPSLRWSPVLWSSTFAMINGVKIGQILLERNLTVHMTDEQEEMYTQFFMPHGITPKQFERIYNKAQTIHIAKNESLIRKGDKLEYVYLVVDGWTRANIMGRHLTAGSFSSETDTPSSKDPKPGGSSGAWVGEIAFLENYWMNEQSNIKKTPTKSDLSTQDEKKAKPEIASGPSTDKEQELTDKAANLASSTNKPTDKAEQEQPQQPVPVIAPTTKPVKVNASEIAAAATPMTQTLSLYTIVAKEDTTVLRWSHADMEELMKSSADLRAGLTRAMTAAIVGKVIQFTMSRTSAIPTSWSAWLDDWKHTAAPTAEFSPTTPKGPLLPLTTGGNGNGNVRYRRKSSAMKILDDDGCEYQ